MKQEHDHSRPSRRWPALFIVVAFCAFFFFLGLGAIGLTGADEPRYAQIAREMLARHDWVTPVLFGKPWLEKPVLYYWAAMVAYKIFGVTDWAARLPSAVSASAMVLAIFAFLRRLRPTAAVDACLITAAAAGCIGFSRAASTDMPLAALFTVAMLCWLRALLPEHWLTQEVGHGRSLQAPDRWALLGFYVFLALATLAKGPIAPGLAALVIIVYAAIARTWKPITATLWWPGVLLFLAIAMPWFVAVQRANPQFAREFFLEQNLARFGTNLYRHKQPFWYYLPVIAVALVPWTVYGVAGFCQGIKESRTEPQAHRDTEERGLPLFLCIWAVVPVVFFSISQSKLPGYILPSIPAWTVLLALFLADRREAARPRWALIIPHSAIAATLVPIAFLLPTMVLRQHIVGLQLVIAGAVGVVLLIAILWTLRTRGLAMLPFATLVPVVVTLAYVVTIDAPVLDGKLSTRVLAREITQMVPKASEVAAFHARREVVYGLSFYLNQTVANYDIGERPAADHLVVAAQGTEDSLRQAVGGRRISHVGTYPAQRLDLFWVSNAPPIQTPEAQKPASMTH
jgi:4-amino-4-deoxy-L-arabinose transferase-like glycosyltransferase